MTSNRDDARVALLRVAREAAFAGDTLPGEFEIARRLGVTRGQVRTLLAELEQRGILKRQQGAATVVDPVALGLITRLDDQVEYSVLLGRMGFAASVELLESAVTALPNPAASELSRPVGESALRIVKRWRADGEPAMVAENHLAVPSTADPLSLLEDHDALEVSLFELVGRVWGQPVIWEIARPGAAVADEQTSALLGIAVGAAVFTLQNVGVTHDGTRVYFSSEWHRPDAVHYSLVRSFAQPWAPGLGALG